MKIALGLVNPGLVSTSLDLMRPTLQNCLELMRPTLQNGLELMRWALRTIKPSYRFSEI